MKNPIFTLVVCTKDRRESLFRWLESLATMLGGVEGKRWTDMDDPIEQLLAEMEKKQWRGKVV